MRFLRRFPCGTSTIRERRLRWDGPSRRCPTGRPCLGLEVTGTGRRSRVGPSFLPRTFRRRGWRVGTRCRASGWAIRTRAFRCLAIRRTCFIRTRRYRGGGRCL
uniref:(northern house mosquito) hypothetical protein n=1 Tax=Culex pipiens TaxID=7175 RepID=A0A8D7ZYV8_CULPI